MTDYLTGLALRNQRYGRGVRPRLPARFEPVRRSGFFYISGLPDTLKNADAPRHRTPLSDELQIEEIERERPEEPSTSRVARHPTVLRIPEATMITRPAPLKGSPLRDRLSERPGTVQPVPEGPVSRMGVRYEIPAREKEYQVGERDVPPDSAKKLRQRKPAVKPVPLLPSADSAMPDDIQKTEPGQDLPDPAKVRKKKTPIPFETAEAEITPGPASQRTDPGQVLLERRETSLAGNIPGIQAEPRMAGFSGKTRIPMPEIVRRYPKEPESGGRNMPAQEPSVQITIGRIEVRSVFEKEAPPRNAAKPALDLSDYLQRRTGRGAK
jgi:hypothetical protein